MKIIGFSSGRIDFEGNVDRMVKTILEKSGYIFQYVKLSNLSFSSCRGCVELCAEPRICKLNDDLYSYYEKLKMSDAVVLGSPVYFNSVNGTMISLIERFFGFRHIENAIKGKPFILVISGGVHMENVKANFIKRLRPFEVKVIKTIIFNSKMPPCVSCGLYKKCTIGGLYYLCGKKSQKLDITDAVFRKWEDCSAVVSQINSAIHLLKNRNLIEKIPNLKIDYKREV